MSTFMERRKTQLNIKSLGDRINEGLTNSGIDTTKLVHGPKYIDCLVNRWMRGKMCGLIGASGIGKTELVMEFFQCILENNPDPNSICVFVSLEMGTDELAQRWVQRVGEKSKLSNRLYVISNYLDNGKSRHLSVKAAVDEIEVLKQALNVTVIATAIDHLHIIHRKDSEDLNQTCHSVKDAAVELDTFMILLSQTTKSQNAGDTPLDQSASFGCSQFSWISDWVITVHAPLKKVSDQSTLNALGWQYAKIRSKHQDDPLQVSINQLLSYDMKSRRLKELTEEQKFEFKHMYDLVLELREAEQKTRFAQYNLGTNRTISNESKVFKNNDDR